MRRELKVSCFSSKNIVNSTIAKQKVVKLVGLSKMRCNLFLTSKGNDKPSKQIHTHTYAMTLVIVLQTHSHTHTHTHSTKQCKSMRARARVLRNYANAKTKVEIVTASKK